MRSKVSEARRVGLRDDCCGADASQLLVTSLVLPAAHSSVKEGVELVTT